MHAVTGFLIFVFVLHVAGILMPLIYGIGVAIVLGVVWGIAKLFWSAENSAAQQTSSSPTLIEPKKHRPISSAPVSITMTMNSSHRKGAEHLQDPISMTYSSGTEDVPTSGLIIKLEPLEKILNGSKIWEMRSITTKKRGPIALIGKGSKSIMGIATIADVRGPLSESTMIQTENVHQIAASRLHDPDVLKLRYAWVLSNVRRLEPSVPYMPRSGAVRFVNLTQEEVAAIRAAL